MDYDAIIVGTGFGATVLFARTDPATGPWQPAQVVAQGKQPRLAVNARGDLVITYERTDQSNPLVPVPRLYAKRRLSGESGFGLEHQLSGPSAIATTNAPYALVIDRDGNATPRKRRELSRRQIRKRGRSAQHGRA